MSQAVPPPIRQLQPQTVCRGLAIAAFVLGVCGFIPVIGILLGLIAIVLGIVALAKGTTSRGFAVAGIVVPIGALLLVQGLVVAIMVPSVSKARELAKEAACSSNLNGIGKALALYDYDQHQYPPDFGPLVDKRLMPPNMLLCPGLRWETRNDQSAPIKVDYFYLMPTQTTPEEALVVCDFRGSHPDGRNVLMMDGSVRLVDEIEFQELLARPENAAFAAALAVARKERVGNGKW